VAVTITLAIGVARMAKRHVITASAGGRNAGGTTIICSDKTGTLTQNQMTVQAIYAAGVNYEVTGSGYEPRGEFRANCSPADPQKQRMLMECLKAGLLCNECTNCPGGRSWKLEGDPTEAPCWSRPARRVNHATSRNLTRVWMPSRSSRPIILPPASQSRG